MRGKLDVIYVAIAVWTVAVVSATVALAQAVPPTDPELGTVWQFAFGVYELLATVVTGAVTWLSVRVATWLKGKIENQLLGSIVGRVSDSIFAAVQMVNQTIKSEIVAAKKPGSPGGVAITKSEADKMKQAVWDALKAEYGGLAGLAKLLGAIGIVGDGVKAWVDTRIEAAVAEAKQNPR